MLDLALFRDRNFVGAAIGMLGYAAAAQVMMTILPIYLQDAFGQSPAIAGLSMIPFALPLLIGPSVGGKLATRMSSRAILCFGLGLTALGDAIIAATILAGFGYWATAIGMFITGSSAGLLNSETAKAQVNAVPAERAGMASGISGATRFVGIISGLAGLGAVIAAVAESSLRRQGMLLVPGQVVDWHALNLRIVGGDVNGGLSVLPAEIQTVIGDTVHQSVAAGFGSALAVGAIIAVVSGALSWRLIRATSTHQTASADKALRPVTTLTPGSENRAVPLIATKV
jgi:MFS family permease